MKPDNGYFLRNDPTQMRSLPSGRRTKDRPLRKSERDETTIAYAIGRAHRNNERFAASFGHHLLDARACGSVPQGGRGLKTRIRKSESVQLDAV